MININSKKYSSFIIEIVHKLPVIPIRLLIIALINYFEELGSDEKIAFQILKNIQYNGHILLTDNGWAMTKKAYRFYTNDRYPKFDLRSEFRLGDKINIYDDGNPQKIIKSVDINDVISHGYKKILDSLWVAFDLLPESRDFIVGMDPWNIMFCSKYDDEPAHCYEIVRISEDMSNVMKDRLSNLTPIIDPEEQENITRIAIVDKEYQVNMVPKVGFRHICVLDDESDTGYKVIRNREKNVWLDYAR